MLSVSHSKASTDDALRCMVMTTTIVEVDIEYYHQRRSSIDSLGALLESEYSWVICNVDIPIESNRVGRSVLSWGDIGTLGQP